MNGRVLDMNAARLPTAELEQDAQDEAVKRLLDLEKEKDAAISAARKAEIEQVKIVYERRNDPLFREIVKSLSRSQPKGETLSLEEFLRKPDVVSEETEREQATADPRSQWSPKLRRLIDEKHPEATKAERIKRAREEPLVTLGTRVPLEIARYYAEDPDLEYDV